MASRNGTADVTRNIKKEEPILGDAIKFAPFQVRISQSSEHREVRKTGLQQDRLQIQENGGKVNTVNSD